MPVPDIAHPPSLHRVLLTQRTGRVQAFRFGSPSIRAAEGAYFECTIDVSARCSHIASSTTGLSVSYRIESKSRCPCDAIRAMRLLRMRNAEQSQLHLTLLPSSLLFLTHSLLHSLPPPPSFTSPNPQTLKNQKTASPPHNEKNIFPSPPHPEPSARPHTRRARSSL